MGKDLKEKAIEIKGKKYVQVADRVLYFNETYKNGSIQTELISDPTSERIVIKAVVIPDVENFTRTFTSYAQEVIGDGMVNKNAAMENADTSAVGRALAMMGIGVIENVASADEMVKAGATRQYSNDPVYVAEELGVCNKCGAENKLSLKTNKPYCSALCWKAKEEVKPEEIPF